MNWTRGLTRIYVALWALLALGGIVVVFLSLSSSWSDDPSAALVAMAWWAGLCLATPAVLLKVVKWIAAGFARNDPTLGRTPQPPQTHASGASVHSSAIRLSTPTTPMPPSRSSRLQFTGRGGDIFSREGLKMCLWYVSIVGIPRGWVYTYRWMMRHLILPSGARVRFTGRAEQVLGVFVALIVLGLLNRLDPTKLLGDTTIALVLTVALAAVLLVAQGLAYFAVLRWVLGNVEFSPSMRLSFKGRALPYVGWTVLTVLSLFTLIGWAWASTAFLRWQMKSTDIVGYRLSFRGSGFGLLWRGIAAFCGCLLILPIPWAIAMLAHWMADNTAMEALEATTGERAAA